MQNGVSYTPGQLLAVVAARTVLVLDAPTDWSLAGPLWELALDDAPVDEVLDVLVRRGIRTSPSFAIVRIEGDAVRALVRGRVPVCFERVGEPVRLDATGATTWLEGLISGATRVLVGDVEQNADLPYRVHTGVVLVSGLALPCGDRSVSGSGPIAVPGSAAQEAGTIVDDAPSGPPSGGLPGESVPAEGLPLGGPPAGGGGEPRPFEPYPYEPRAPRVVDLTRGGRPAVPVPVVPVASAVAAPADAVPVPPEAPPANPFAPPEDDLDSAPAPAAGVAEPAEDRFPEIISRHAESAAAESAAAEPGPAESGPAESGPAESGPAEVAEFAAPTVEEEAPASEPFMEEAPASEPFAEEAPVSEPFAEDEPLEEVDELAVVDQPAPIEEPAEAPVEAPTSFEPLEEPDEAEPVHEPEPVDEPEPAAVQSPDEVDEARIVGSADGADGPEQTGLEETGPEPDAEVAAPASEPEPSDPAPSDPQGVRWVEPRFGWEPTELGGYLPAPSAAAAPASEPEPIDASSEGTLTDTDWSRAGWSSSEWALGSAASEADRDAVPETGLDPLWGHDQLLSGHDLPGHDDLPGAPRSGDAQVDDDDLLVNGHARGPLPTELPNFRPATSLNVSPQGTGHPDDEPAEPFGVPRPAFGNAALSAPAEPVQPVGAQRDATERVEESFEDYVRSRAQELGADDADAGLPFRVRGQTLRPEQQVPFGGLRGSGGTWPRAGENAGSPFIPAPPDLNGINGRPAGEEPTESDGPGEPPAEEESDSSDGLLLPAFFRGARAARSKTTEPDHPTPVWARGSQPERQSDWSGPGALRGPAGPGGGFPLNGGRFGRGQGPAEGQSGGEQLPPREPPRLLGVWCDAGHVTSPDRPDCRVCGLRVPPQAPILVARPPLGVLVFDNGDRVEIDRPVILGRDPKSVASPDPEPPVLHPVQSASGQVSRTHAEIRASGWDVVITDLDAMNGTTVTSPGGASVTIEPGVPTVISAGTRADLGGESGFVFEVEG